MEKILTTKEKRILKIQLLFLILSLGLIVYSIWTELISNSFPYFLLVGWFLSIISSTCCSFLLNWRRFFLTLISGILFPPLWFIGSVIGVTSGHRTGSGLGEFLIIVLFGYILYFKLILETEGYSELQWKQLC